LGNLRVYSICRATLAIGCPHPPSIYCVCNKVEIPPTQHHASLPLGCCDPRLQVLLNQIPLRCRI